MNLLPVRVVIEGNDQGHPPQRCQLSALIKPAILDRHIWLCGVHIWHFLRNYPGIDKGLAGRY